MVQDVVAITGAGGFIGRATVGLLHAYEQEVVGLVGPASAEPLPPPPGPGRWSWGSIGDERTATQLLEGCTSVIHLAGSPSVAKSFAEPAEFVASHATGTATLIQAAVRLGTVRRIVVVSSAEVYGLPFRATVSEDDAPDPLSPYAVAKLGAEGIARVLGRTHGLEVVVIRPFAVYGPASPLWSLVGVAMAQAMQTGAEPVLMNDLTRVRDLVYVDDVAELLFRSATTPLLDGAGRCVTLNAATGRGTSVLALAHAALAAVGRTAEVRQRPPNPEPSQQDILRGARPPWSDPMRLVGSPARAGDLLGWVPKTALESGLATILDERRRTTS